MRIRIAGWLAATSLALPLAASAQMQPSSPREQTPAQIQQQKQARQEEQAKMQRLGQPPTQEQLKNIDPGEVLAQLHQINRAEIASAQLALEKGKSREVKDMARQIINDHQRLDRQVMQVAQQQNIQLAQPFSLPGAAHDKAIQANQQQLRKLSGEKFDKAWLASQPLQHEYALSVVQLAQQADFSEQGMNQLLQQAEQELTRHQQHASRMLQQTFQVASQPQPRTSG
jgi:putative membrane protein